MLPLQISYLQESDPVMGIALFAALGVLIAVLAISNIAKNGIGSSSSSFGAAPSGGRRFSRWATRKAASSYGLDGDQAALLEAIFRKAQVSDPAATMANASLLDKHFKRAFREIESAADTDAAAEENKSLLFSIRGAVESAQGSQARVVSSHRLPDGLAATLTNQKGETYPVRIVSAKGENLVVDAPRSAVGTPIRLPRGAKVFLSFYVKSSQGFRFETRCMGTQDTPRGPVLELAHSDRIAALPNRRHRRKEVRMSCYFAHVTIEERMVGRKVEKKTLVDDRRALGTVMDVSAGGCAIKSAAPLRAGEYLKIEFDDPHGRALAALGRVVRTNKAGAVGGIMHVQFVKSTRRTINAINAAVYGYDQD